MKKLFLFITLFVGYVSFSLANEDAVFSNYVMFTFEVE